LTGALVLQAWVSLLSGDSSLTLWRWFLNYCSFFCIECWYYQIEYPGVNWEFLFVKGKIDPPYRPVQDWSMLPNDKAAPFILELFLKFKRTVVWDFRVVFVLNRFI
jgi:hypothetical protein